MAVVSKFIHMHSLRFCVMITKVTVTGYNACDHDDLCDDWPKADDSVGLKDMSHSFCQSAWAGYCVPLLKGVSLNTYFRKSFDTVQSKSRSSGVLPYAAH